MHRASQDQSPRRHPYQQQRAFSPAVVSEGGRTIWLAGQTTTQDLQGQDISGQFEAQVRTCFALIQGTLARCDADLRNLVWMTVFIDDPRHGDRFVDIRSELLGSTGFPASTLITVSHFARPGIVVEIQAIAVV